MTPADAFDISVVVPVYNRPHLLGYSLESIRRGRNSLAVQVIVVDDGSVPPLDSNLPILRSVDAQLVRQPNRGLLYARLRGLAECTGRYVLFLDSDDMVSVSKLSAHVVAMDRSGSDVSYSDTARCKLEGDYDSLVFERDPSPVVATTIAGFFIEVQPAPHSPVWRTTFLKKAVEQAFIPPSPAYNSVAEIWFYHNAASRTGTVEYVRDATAIVGMHGEARLTNHWEKLGVASLAVMEAFVRFSPSDTATSLEARQLVAEKAFTSWRRLPRNFSPDFCTRMLAVWRSLSREVRLSRLGGGGFQRLARLLGPVNAARLLKRWQAGSYDSCRTMTDAEFRALLQAIPLPDTQGSQ